MNILAIIPARKGSRRVPDKNFRSFAGKPLFCHVTESALGAASLTDIVVSTDHNGILEYVAREFPRVFTVKRPAEFCTDTSPAIDYVRHAIRYMHENFGKTYDVVVILQPSSPFTLASDIDGTVAMLVGSGADTAVSVVKLDHMIHPLKLKTLGPSNQLNPFLNEENNRMAVEELPDVYVRNCSVYASTLATINKGLIIGLDCRGFIMPSDRSMDINEMRDFEFAEWLYQKKINEEDKANARSATKF